ncbi:MAG: aminopeptidase, partial [Bacteroidales bacterium]|nr:aminopeptidase [Bacteroidales bacterium]
TFKKSPFISTYLFAFATGEFKKLTRTKNGRTLSLFHREPDNEKVNLNIDDIFELHFIAIEWMEKYTGIPYPFNKLDFVAIPSFQYRGMEHVDAIFYRSSMLFLPKSASANLKMQRASMITHETSHMWFGDLVTMKWFDDVWLKEVFANFFAEKMIQPFFPEINQDLVFMNARFPRAYSIDRTKGTTPIIQKLDNLKYAGTLYGRIIYDKAPIIMAKIEQMIGKDSLQESLREYLNTYEYGNANWDDLIKIIDKRTTINLNEWSKVWVEKAGMPHISATYELDKNNIISKFIIKQKAYDNSDGLWCQRIEILASKNGKITKYPIYFDKNEMLINDIAGTDKPDYFLLNGDGYGYGYFEMDTASINFLLNNLCEIKDSKIRAISYITLYQALLNYKLKPNLLINKIVGFLETDNENLNIPLLLDYFEQIWWYFLSKEERMLLAENIENKLVKLIKNKKDKEASMLIYSELTAIFITENLTDKFFDTWKYEKDFEGLKLSKRDYIDLAFELVLREHPETENIIKEQLSRVKNPDVKKEIEFIFPAISPKQETRDLFFESLKKVENRQHETWVNTALNYLNHPLRAKHSIKYLNTSLEMLEEIQASGDIFFPNNWLAKTIGKCNSPEAAQIVRDFLKNHPNYNQNLKLKILQYSDILFRAEKIFKN